MYYTEIIRNNLSRVKYCIYDDLSDKIMKCPTNYMLNVL